MQKPAGMRSITSILPKPKLATDGPETGAADDSGESVKKQTLYLPFGVHDQIRDEAHAKRISQQEIFRRALDLYFADAGLPSWDEAKAKGERR